MAASASPLANTAARAATPEAPATPMPTDAFARSGQSSDLGLIPSMYPLVGGRVEPEKAGEMLENVPGWQLKEIEGSPQLQREYKFKNFRTAMAFSNQVAEFAEVQKHHPSLHTEWGKVTVGWWTHDVGGLHANDFLSAQRTDAVFAAGKRPPAA